MGLNIHTEIAIDADASKVWAALTDPEMKAWNPVMSRLTGDFVVGGTIKAVLHLQIISKLKVKAKLVKCEENVELAWLGGVPLLFKGLHGFRIEPLAEGRVRFVHYEHFNGLIAAILTKRLRTLEGDYNRLNEAIKQKAESL